MIINQRLKEIRRERTMTQKEVCKKIGITASGFASWEQGRTEPDVQRIKQLCELFNVSADYLIGLTEYLNEPINESNGMLINNKIITEKRKSIQINANLLPKENELIRYFKKMKPFDQGQLLGMARTLARGL